MTIPELLDARSTQLAEKTFIVCEEETLSYRELQHRTATVAANLSQRGISKGDKIALLMPNCLEFLYVFLGAGRVGAVAVPINPMLKPEEIGHIANDSDARILVTIPEFAPLLPDLLPTLPRIEQVFILGEPAPGAQAFAELLRPVEQIPESVAAPDDDAALIYTSGTTGMPKGVILSHRNYVSNALMIARAIDIAPDDRFLCVLPLFHVNAQVVTILAPLMASASVVLMKKFAPFSILPMIEKHRVTILSAVPTIYNVMCRMPKVEEYDVSSIRFFVSGAAPLPEETYQEVLRVLKRPLIMGYGLSEATCASAVADYRDPIKWSSVGSPMRYTSIRVLDDSGVDVPYGDVGEITIAGPTVMKGYYKDPQATESVLKNGWLYTGDLGRFDGDGYLYIVGRKKDMIIRGGQNVYPQQIENTLSRLPGVEECCVVGIDEPRWGQEVLAVVKLGEGYALTEREIIDHCRTHLAAYKCPRYVQFIDALPKTATGKIKKGEVAARYAHLCRR